MSWLSRYIKNVKAGYKGLKEDIQVARAKANPVDTYGQASRGEVFGYSSPEEKQKTESSPRFKQAKAASEYKVAQKKQREQAVVNAAKFREEARDNPANYREIKDDEGNVVRRKFVEPKTTGGQSREIGDGFGLSGFNKDYSGMTYDQAISAAQADNEFYRSQTSQNTSYTFNPESLAGASKSVTDAQFKIKDTMNDGWNSAGSVETKTKAIIGKTELEISNMFDSPEEFDAAYNSDAKFAQTIDTLTELGGDTAKIQSEIKNRPKVSDQVGNVQDLATYLQVGNSAAEQKAFNTLIPESKMAQDQIQNLANIPKQYADLYFGTPESIGIYQERQLQAKESQRILEEQARDAEDNLKAQTKLQAQKYKFQFDQQSAEIETNRLNAKNYMTGMLAKMGALNTTGKAPVALANLEEKYQAQATALKQNYMFATTELDYKLDAQLNDIENNLDAQILKVNTGLTDDKEKMMKEILKLQASSNEDIYKLQSSFGKEYRKQLEKYKKEGTANSNNYINGMYKAVSTYDAAGAAKTLGLEEGMTFEQYLAERERTEGGKNPFGDGYIGMNFSESGREQVRADYENLKKQKAEQEKEAKLAGLSSYARDVVDGNANWPTGSSSTHQNARNQLRAAGYSKSDFDGKSNSDDSDSDDELDFL